MKRIIITLVLLLSAIASFAQVQFLAGESKKAVIEAEKAYDKLYVYSYLEAGELGGYWQVIGEYQITRLPIALHLETRTAFCDDFIGFAGVSYNINLKNGFVGTSLLCRTEKGKTTGQLGFVNSLDFGWVDFYGYADIWHDKSVQLFIEERCYFKAWKDISVGGVINVFYGDKWDFIPYMGVRYKF